MARLAIRMPKMSMTMTEGEVSSWLVAVGDEVANGDVVCEVMTDKVDMEVESSVSGTLVEIVVESGMADVGAPIGWVEGEDDGGGFGDLLGAAADPAPAAVPPPAPAAAEPTPEPAPEPADEPGAEPAPEPPASAPEPQPASPPTASGPAGGPPGVPAEEAPATVLPVEPSAAADAPTAAPDGDPRPLQVAAVPRARALARTEGLDLASIDGSGADGLVRLEDVEARTARSTPPTPPPAPAAPAPAATPAVTAPTTATRRPAAAAGGPAGGPVGGTVDKRKAGIRRAVARTMTQSALVPQFTVWREIHLDAADTARHGVSWTTVLLRAYAKALRDVPDLLCRWEDDGPTEAGPPTVSLAVATDRGLLVPTFTEPDQGPAERLDAEIRTVVRAAHTGRLDPAYLGLANASLSNLGGLGVDRFQALLTPPQASVLSLGTIVRRPVAVPGGIGSALTVHVGLTVDHRVADGAHGAQLLSRMAALLEASV